MSAQWARLTEYLSGQGTTVTLEWWEFERIVGGVPASAINHYPQWWHGDRSNTRAWRAAGYEVATVAPGQSVTFVRTRPPSGGRSRAVAVPPAARAQPEDRLTRPPSRSDASRRTTPDVVLISCVKTKLAAPAAARDLYVSPYFRRMRRYAEDSGCPWFILSAEHGLVSPEERLAPYEMYLPDSSASYRAEWGTRVVQQLSYRLGHLRGQRIEIHAGATYVAALQSLLEEAGCCVDDPLAGLSLGRRSSWYGNL